MAYADDRTAEPEHRPISEDDASLRQSIKPEGPCDPEGNFTEPECERRSKVAAEHEFVPYGQQHRHFAGRRAVEQGRNERPKRCLRQRNRPEHDCGASA